jgi:tetratricopeptide (TPR) repeat protein
VLLGGAERTVDAWNARWPRRVAEGERLVDAKRYAEAVVFLEELDRDFPALYVKHRFDREKERLLTALGRAYTGLDKKKRALETFERLVQFDPRNWANHLALAEACVTFVELDRAKQAFAAVLAIHPSHLPALKGLIQLHYDGSLYANIPPLYEAYLDAYVLAPLTLSFAERSVVLEVPADGRPHRVEAALELPAGWRGEMCLATRGWSVTVGAIELTAPLRAGVAGVPEMLRVEVPPNAGEWKAQSAQETRPGVFAAQDKSARICRDLAAPASGTARIALEITVYKALDAGLWTEVETSYKNRLAWEALEIARQRSLIGGCREAGSIFED